MGICIGIDLGTTNSVVAYQGETRAEVIPSSEGSKIVPSVVHYDREGKAMVGELAKRLLLVSPESTIYSVKRLIGKRYSDVQDIISHLTYKVVADDYGNAVVEVNNQKLTPEEISAEILKKMKRSAEEYLNEEVEGAVITVPAYFNDGQRQATKRAAELAGLRVLRIINEPTAASLAYGVNREKEGLVAVFDFGGGTFDISILEFSSDVYEVKSTAGDTLLGGDDIDNILVHFIADEIKKQYNIDVLEDLELHRRVKETAEKVKCELSYLERTIINIPFLYADATGAKHFNREITREEFNGLIQPILDRLIPPCRQAIQDANITLGDLSEVLLVGGSTRIPAVQELAKKIFHLEPSKGINPDEAVALGAAIQSAIINGSIREVILLDVTPHSLGIETEGDKFSVIIPRNSNIPTSAVKKFTTTVDNQTTVRIHVLQGESKFASRNYSLAFFKLTGITPAPKEVPEIEVKFQIDANGILNVSAVDVSSGVKKEISVEAYQEILSVPPHQKSEDREFTGWSIPKKEHLTKTPESESPELDKQKSELPETSEALDPTEELDF